MATQTQTMKALHYEGPFKVSVKEVALPKIEHPDDVVIKVTTAGMCGPSSLLVSLKLFLRSLVSKLTWSFSAICGSDLHMYQGRTAAESGLIFGHENMGIITEVGAGVTLLKKGDRIVLPFNVADGRCRNCEEGRTAFCTGMPCRLSALESHIQDHGS